MTPALPTLLVTTAHPSLYKHGLGNIFPHPHLGRLIQPRHTSSIEQTAAAGITWAADNDCFQGLDANAYVRMLDRIAGLDGCRFVTVPDVVGDATETLKLWQTWAPELDRRGLPKGLVAQDGLELVADTLRWSEIDALFIGGSTEWKESTAAAELAQTASAHGKWVHWGRVNTRRRFDLIVRTGAVDSWDGSKWARFRTTYLDTGLSWCLEAAQAAEALRHEFDAELEEVLS